MKKTLLAVTPEGEPLAHFPNHGDRAVIRMLRLLAAEKSEPGVVAALSPILPQIKKAATDGDR